MNCSASISGQSSYSNITNHSDQCNQDVGVPIIVERSSNIRNGSSGKVIERVEGQVLKNNNCVKTIDDKLRSENKSSDVRTGYSDKLIVSESNDEDDNNKKLKQNMYYENNESSSAFKLACK